MGSMTGKPEQEPSIEEILASIRQIISDDDEPRTAEVDLSAKEEPAPVADDSFADVLELTNEIPQAAPPPPPVEPTRPSFDLDLAEPPAPPPPPKPAPAPKFETQDIGDAIFTATAAAATADAFARLKGNVPVEREENRTLYADGRVTLEDIVREMMRPMLRDWINDHVPTIVERLVEKELEKLARQAQRD
jgi:uncharacterized protein